MNSRGTNSYILEGKEIREFNVYYLRYNLKCQHFTQEQWEYIDSAMKVAEDFHTGEIRNISGDPYITHPIEIVKEEIREQEWPNWKSIVVLIIHDTLESHPERWREIFKTVPMSLFGRILKLSKLPPKIRFEIYSFLKKEITEDSDQGYILDMLSHDIGRRNAILSSQVNDVERGAFKSLIDSYAKHLDKFCPELSQDKKDTEIDGLWHYIFFNDIDARHKFRDTMHNLSDVKNMKPAEKKRYILRRIPKLQALAFALNRFSMADELQQLKRRWQEVGGRYNHLGIFSMHDQFHEILGQVPTSVKDITSGV